MSKPDKHMKKGEYERELARRRREKKRIWKRIHFFGMLLILIVFLVVCLNIFSDKKTLRKEALSLYNEGNYKEALSGFEKAYDEKQWFSDSLDIDILKYEADCMMRLQLFDDAEQIYKTIKKDYSARQYDAEELDFLLSTVHALSKFQQGDFVSTTAAFTSAVEAGHKDMSIYAAICYENQRNYEKMKEYLDIFAQYNGMDSYLYYKYASYYYQLKDYTQTLSYLSQGSSCADTTYMQEIKYAEIICYKEMLDYNQAYALASAYVNAYPEDQKGQDILAYLDTRINLNEIPINDKFHVVPESEESIAE